MMLVIFKTPSKQLPNDLVVTLDGNVIKPSTTVRLLGVTLDCHIIFGEDIDQILLKCHGLIGMLARAAPFLTTELLRLTYIGLALIRSKLEYASAVRASAAPTHLRRLDVIQKIASRVISRAPRNAHSAPLQLALGLESLATRRDNHVVELVRSLASERCHPAFGGQFYLSSDGLIVNRATGRIGIGRRRITVYGKELFNKHLTRLRTETR